MRSINHAAALALSVGTALGSQASAQEASATGTNPPATTSPAVAQEVDTTGTNPAVLSRTLSFSDEYRFLPDDSYYNVINLRYTEPFLDGRAAVRLTMPFNGTDLADQKDGGFGDVSVRLSWIPIATQRQAFVLSTEVFAPTAEEDSLGSGQWVVAPGLTWAYFASRELIIAPAYIQSISVAGDDDRAEVNRSDFDLYVVYRPQGRRWWITSDVTASHDFETESSPASWEVAFGRNLAVLRSGGALNGYIRPGIGIGDDRPYDYNIEVGLSVVNF